MSNFKCQHKACDNWTFGDLCMYPKEAKVNCEERSRRMSDAEYYKDVDDELDAEDLLEYEEYCIGYQQGREDAIDEYIPKAFEWLMQMDIINCDGCNYTSECVNRNMNCYDVMAEKFLEYIKEKNHEER